MACLGLKPGAAGVGADEFTELPIAVPLKLAYVNYKKAGADVLNQF